MPLEIRVPGDSFGGGKGFQIVPGTDGNLYGLRWPYKFHKWDRRGKPVAWEHPMRPTEQDALFNSSKVTGDYPPKLDASVSFVPVSMVELPHTLGIRQSDGHLFAFTFLVRGRVPKCLHEYLPTGQRVTTNPIIWMTSDAVIGPKFDAAGNIYFGSGEGRLFVLNPDGTPHETNKRASLRKLMEKRPEEVVLRAVKGMLPHNALAVSPQRDIQIVPQPIGQRNMPPPPEFRGSR